MEGLVTRMKMTLSAALPSIETSDMLPPEGVKPSPKSNKRSWEEKTVRRDFFPSRGKIFSPDRSDGHRPPLQAKLLIDCDGDESFWKLHLPKPVIR